MGHIQRSDHQECIDKGKESEACDRELPAGRLTGSRRASLVELNDGPGVSADGRGSDEGSNGR